MRSTLGGPAGSAAALVAVQTLLTPLPALLWVAFGAVAVARVVFAAAEASLPRGPLAATGALPGSGPAICGSP